MPVFAQLLPFIFCMPMSHPRLFCFPDYLYYCVTSWFGPHDDGSRAGVIISAMYTAPFFAVATWTVYALAGTPGVHQQLKALTILAAVVFALFTLLNYRRYRDSYARLSAQWSHLGRHERTVKTVAAVGGCLLIFLASFLVVHFTPF